MPFFVSPGVMLAVGLVVGLSVGNPWSKWTKKATPLLLGVAVTGLGAGVDLAVILRAGRDGIGFTVAGIALALGLGTLLSRALRVSPKLGALISVGTAICGGSAIAAMVPILKPKDHEVSAALGVVFLLNAVALFAFPPIGHALGMTDAQFGLWSAVAIHDTSSVVGAAVAYGGSAATVATTVKLARALWIVPVSFAAALLVRSEDASGEKTKARPKLPWFIVGFLAAAALVSAVPSLAPVGADVATGARYLLSATMLLVGLGISRDALRAVGFRAFVVGALLWLVVASASLAALLLIR